ncbi:unnamed protein product [Pieris brassicae]|uniref:Class II aldolase/adducin N-terminal domain-containing protein n=1 Tax=Pieris brassicae TaxID=7116 RepID=A0A9P0TSK1_PIEBR|nr:unnamed protein product [Pieris brassicae]
MADTDTETLPNGNATLSAEEEERLKQRPADIDADVREMERRKRVEALMSSRLFREELERVLDQQMHEGNDAPLLQRIREMVGGRLHTGSLRGPSCVLPINDIRGIEGVGYEKGEKILRCKLAAVYRLVDLFGWTQTGFTGQITARLNTAVEQVLTTPRGLLPHEVTASSLVKVDMQGTVVDQGTTNFPVNVEGFSLHASVHAARPDIRCVLHLRSPSALAISSTKRGLLALCSEAATLGILAYHRVPLGVLDNEECDKLVRALGPHSKVLMLSCGGALCCGATLEEAFYQAKNLNTACEVQLRLATLPLDELNVFDEETAKQIYDSTHKPPADEKKWRVGGEEFEALMRMLDNAGFRTGYIYRHPLVKNDVPKPKNDVEVPPAVSSLGYLLEEEELYKQGIWKKGGKTGERTRWLNSPNVYQKVEVLETGTTDPKKITKWVQDGSPAHSSTPVKIDTLQFVPKNTNPKEFKQLQQQIKENRRADKISAGPQSHILEGVTWDEAAKLVGEDAANTHTGDHVVLMGAASKGIIQRGYQHNATVYSAPYARNPFDHVTDTEIDEYRRIVERKQRSEYDTDLSESEAISAAQITSPASAPSETEEESRDEHRVLRIETKQAPVRSQPEVVLSDVDTTDFLAAERDHADRTRDSNLLSDDEVFLDSSSIPSGVTSPSIPETSIIPEHVIVRTQFAAVQQTVKGTKLSPHGAHKRTLHSFPRSSNFNHIVQKYEGPKCKQNLNQKLTAADTIAVYKDNVSCSSTFSLQSLDSFPKYHMRTRSLPRKLKTEFTPVYRTRSHGAFVNSYINNPEPEHFHVPKCDSCGSINNTYAWEMRKIDPKYKQYGSLYYSIDNLANGVEELKMYSKPKITQTSDSDEVPTLDLKCEEEFVESQEFNEDNYFDDVTNCLSENHIETAEVQRAEDAKSEGIFRAEYVTVQTQTDFSYNTLDSEGEYHSFTEDMLEDIDAVVYESPVKNLVDKDIRDYSVPINFYCEEYGKKDSPRVSPLKKKEAPKNILEPILEESKSYEESTSDSNKTQHSETDLTDPKIVPKNEEIDTHPFFEDFKRPKEPPKRESLLQNDARSSCGMSTLSTVNSFDSTAEFEKLEAVTEIIDLILGKINFVVDRNENLFAKSIQDANNEPNGLFSITDIISDIENNVPDHTPVDISDSFMTDSLRVAEAVLYYIFNRAICSSHSRKSKQITKTVITIVDVEDILLTTSREWMGIFHDFTFNEISDVIVDSRDTNKGRQQFDNKSEEVHIVLNMSHGVPLYLDNIGSNTSDSNEDLPFYGNDTDFPDCPPDATPKSEDNKNSDNNEFNLNANHNFEESSDTICDLLEKSINTISHLKEDMNETFVIQDKMNEAFVDSQFSHSSTPQRVVFECHESPINASRYERDDSILSPFLKKTQVLSMSQTEHRGGIKYWVSFSDDIETEKDGRSLKKFNDDSVPSYYVVDFEENDNGKVLERNDFSNETFSKYDSCESEKMEGKLIYDLREKRRMSRSWPPTDESLFYRILSNFRMSQSFELSDLNYTKFENSEHTLNGDHSDAHQSTFSHSSKEGSPSKEISTEDSPKKDKKKKKGLRTPSFLKKKKEKKKEKSSTPQPA